MTSPASMLSGDSNHPPSVPTADTTRSPTRVNSLRCDSRKLRADEATVTARAKLRAMTPTGTPVRFGARDRPADATCPGTPNHRGSTRWQSAAIQLIAGIESTSAESHHKVAAALPQATERDD